MLKCALPPVVCIIITNDHSTQTIHQDSFETSSAGENEEAMSNGDAVVTIPEPPSPPPVPKTVAEKLELVKSEEADLLRQFEDTHKQSAQVRGNVFVL